MSFQLAKIFDQKETTNKAATIKRFEYQPLDSKLKKQTDIAKKQYQKILTMFLSMAKKNH